MGAKTKRMINLGDGFERNPSSKARMNKQAEERLVAQNPLAGGVSIYQHQNLTSRAATEQVFKFI